MSTSILEALQANVDGANAVANVRLPAYDRKKVLQGIAHIGVGNFHRAHQAFYVDRALHLPGQEQWGICGIGLGIDDGAAQKRDNFEKQDGLFTLVEYGNDGSLEMSVVGSIVDYIHAPDDPARAIEKLADPAIRIVSLTITEGGYNIDPITGAFDLANPAVAADLAGDQSRPKTVFAYVVEALRRRRERGLGGFTVVSCDNLRQNGDVARKAFTAYAAARSAELAGWIEENVTFPGSMIDRIVPRVTDADRDRLNAASGLDDAMPVAAETFTQWVIEDKFVAGRPDLGAVGVEIRPDVRAFEQIKGRMLNSSHMMLCFAAVMMGHRIVHEAMKDPRFPRLLRTFMDRDVIPRLDHPQDVSLEDYRDTVIDRLRNPGVADQLLRVAQDGISKVPVFLTKTLTMVTADGGDPQRLAFLMAAFRRYFHEVDDNGERFVATEPNLSAEDRALIKSEDPVDALKVAPLLAIGLADNAAFREAYLAAHGIMAAEGTSKAFDALDLD